MDSVFTFLGWALLAIALIGTGYAMLAAVLAGRFMRAAPKAPVHHPAVTILKPLHQCDPDLAKNLETFFTQDYPASVQIVFGVHDQADPAIAVVRALQAKYPRGDTMLVVDAALYGANAKVSNLINMLPSAKSVATCASHCCACALLNDRMDKISAPTDSCSCGTQSSTLKLFNSCFER